MSDAAEKIAILEARLEAQKIEARLAAEKIANLEARLKEEYKAQITIEGGQASTTGNCKYLIVMCSADVSSGALLMLKARLLLKQKVKCTFNLFV